MARVLIGFGLLALVPDTAALADTMTASRPGLMCASADALARLTLPDGSDRAASPHARPGDGASAQQGGCIAIPHGALVTLQVARRNTSIVTYDARDGRGSRTFVVPNVDFAPGPAAAASGDCLSYGVAMAVSGRITVGSAYGEDIHTGKVGWARWRQITLDRPICTRGDAQAYEEPEHDVRAMQPVWTHGDVYALPLGEHVTVAGKLFHADNGNQMTAVLIEVDSITGRR